MTIICKILQGFAVKSPNSLRYSSKLNKNKSSTHVHFYTMLVAAGTAAVCTAYQCRKNQSILAYQAQGAGKSRRTVKLPPRERRFIRFASVEYDGQLYMTPQDFLDSVVEAKPRTHLKRKMLTVTDMDYLQENTPSLTQGSPRLFRNLRDKGIISYAEYLFLLSVLIKPQSGFRIAFNMFDTDGNQRVDKNEFPVIRKLLVGKHKGDPQTMKNVSSHASKGKRRLASDPKVHTEEYIDDDAQGLQRRHDTTLVIHFFGPKGKNELTFETFQKFMTDLQTEVLELEFSEFAKGLPSISEVDFAKNLLRYTYLDTDEGDIHLERLLNRIKETKGITFEEFYIFCQFLNNLEDFNIAMRMYSLADHRISKDEFHRAVKICTGTSLSQHVVHTVFSIFDEDGDGLLRHSEFIAIMKDRLHRGFKLFAKKGGWNAFKKCIKQEMRKPS